MSVNSDGSANGRRALLIGGAGYIGSVLTRELLAAGYAVRCLDLLIYGHRESVSPYLGSPAYEFIHGDFADPGTVGRALDGVTDIVMLAGLVGDPITKKYPDAARAINEEAVRALVPAVSGNRALRRFVFVSTCSNYGLVPENDSADENYELRPLSAYARAKVEAERMWLGLRGRARCEVTVLRFATAFGCSPRMRFDLTVNEFTREMSLGRPLEVYDPKTWRPYCHVDDFALAIRGVLEAPAEKVAFEIFNAGGDENNFTKEMIVEEIRRFLPAAPVRYRERGEDLRNYRVDFSKIRSVLGFRPRWSVRDGVREILDALEKGRFDDADRRRDFYGNYTVRYAPDASARPAEEFHARF